MIPQVHKIIILNWHTLYLVSNKLVYNDSFSIFDVQILHPFFLISQKNIPNVGILLRCIPLTFFQLRWTITHFVNLRNSRMHTRTSVAVWSFFISVLKINLKSRFTLLSILMYPDRIGEICPPQERPRSQSVVPSTGACDTVNRN